MAFCKMLIIRVLLLVLEISMQSDVQQKRLVNEALNVGYDNGEWKGVLAQLLEVGY